MMKNNSTLKQKLKSKGGFYTILALCLAIAGTGSFLTTRITMKSNKETTAPPSEITVTTTAPPETQVNDIVTGIPDERYNTSEPESSTLFSRADEFTLPLGSAVIKDFSNCELVQSKTMGDWRVHNGIDFSGAAGDKVRAINNGVITRVYDDALWGTVVEIDHGNGMTAKYCGFQKDSTPGEGVVVNSGEEIGLLGEIPIEEADGTHLHLEIRQDGIATDPIIAMGKTPDDMQHE